jgi:xanthine/CO dehydrogenase XdhC/CoxF family maturation factor
MHLGLTALSNFFAGHNDDEALVIATVVDTRGSTYRKPGAMMLISAGGDYAGMISGGCLENDLLEHAVGVFETGMPKRVTYDMYADEQLVWSLGLGCDGVIILLLQRLDRADGFAFLPRLLDAQSNRLSVTLALVTNEAGDPLHAGCWAMLDEEGVSSGSDELLPSLMQSKFSPFTRHLKKIVNSPGRDAELLLINIQPAPTILICGGGPDALPIARLVTDLGWGCIIIDHRSHYAQAGRFPAAASVIHGRPETLADQVALAEIDAVVIMSHHLDNDAVYLEACIKATGIRYIGILGPASRRAKLLARVDSSRSQVFGPVGLDIGAELPESIALSTVAEIHAVLNERDGGSLTQG